MFKAILDQDQLKSPLKFAKTSEGDVFQPLGMKGHSIKISDYWVNRKLPKKYRERYPVLRDESGIVWIPGSRSVTI